MKSNDRPRPRDIANLYGYDIEEVASVNDQTGLIPAAIQNAEEADAYEELYPIPKQKPVK